MYVSECGWPCPIHQSQVTHRSAVIGRCYGSASGNTHGGWGIHTPPADDIYKLPFRRCWACVMSMWAFFRHVRCGTWLARVSVHVTVCVCVPGKQVTFTTQTPTTGIWVKLDPFILGIEPGLLTARVICPEGEWVSASSGKHGREDGRQNCETGLPARIFINSQRRSLCCRNGGKVMCIARTTHNLY